MTSPSLHAAIDLGASSARLSAGRLEGDRLVVKEVARLPNAPVRLPDGIHWDLLALHQGMLEALGRLHRDLGGGALWVGVDSWGVDYGLLDIEGRLLGPPFHYRDERTTGRLDELDGLVGLQRVYDATGTQAMAINTICQLLTERGTTAYGAASHLLMVPDLFAFLLTGERRLERTIASTTQLVNARNGDLVDWLFPVLGLRRDLFPAGIEPGEHYGRMLPEVAASVGIQPAPLVVAVASHDTASAVLAVPALSEDFAYVSSGTWSLVGLELDAPVITEASRRANFSNELGFGDTVRFLKNVMGYWMIQESERCWAHEGQPVDLGELYLEAEGCPPFRSVVDTAEPAFAVPGDMPARVRAACGARGEPVPETAAEVVRCVLDSVALDISTALDEAQRCAGKRVSVLHVVGGGSANRLFLSLLAACSGLEVVAGPTEATVIGNLLAQLSSAGKVGDQADMRQLVARSFPLAHVWPDPVLAEAADRARRRFSKPESPVSQSPR